LARTTKLSGNATKQEPAEQLLETIIEDVVKAAAMSFEDWWSLSSSPFTPLAIPVGQERQYRVTQAGVNAAHRLTEQTWQNHKDLQQTIARDEFEKLSFRAIGESIFNCRSHLPNDTKDPESSPPEASFFAAVALDYASNLDKLAGHARPDFVRHIPCHLFHRDQNVGAFSVGPVEFLPRSDWITRFVKDSVQLVYIQQVERGEVNYSEFRDRALASSSGKDLQGAWNILNSLQNFEWVATITMKGHELHQSHYKASIFIGLAIDAIGLRFQVEDARRITKAGRQHLFSENRLATSSDGVFLQGTSMHLPGLRSNPGALAAKMLAERTFLDAAGKGLETYVLGRQTGQAPHLVERWANALYWVGEARREASDFMAVVKYGCAADGLSGAGGDAKVMTTFAEAALNPKGEPTPSGSLSIADAVKKVYCEGRNKLAHGEMAGLLEDLSKTRAIGDVLLVGLFNTFTLELAEVIAERPIIFTLDEKNAYRAFQTRLKQRANRNEP
jgi:hypothetical protein